MDAIVINCLNPNIFPPCIIKSLNLAHCLRPNFIYQLGLIKSTKHRRLITTFES